MDRKFYSLFDNFIVCFSGGKDCTAAFLHLLDMGVPASKIELWHHEIDGREGKPLMDWACTPAYCRAFAAAFNVPIYFSWKEGGFEREMLRENSLTAPTKFEDQDGIVRTVGGLRGKESTRLKFPQVSGDLKVRWCSGYLKIDICAAAIRNQKRFVGKKVCVVSGERGEESTQRSKYAEMEADRADGGGRDVTRIRPVKNWLEHQVWAIIERYMVRVHPCYYLGWARCSCLFCIFGNPNQFASAYFLSPEQGDRVIGYENTFGVTIKRKLSLEQVIYKGLPYEAITENKEQMDAALSTNYMLNIIMQEWILPAGAYGEACGPS